MANILVAYYSRSGSTAHVARAVAGRLGADLDPIRSTASYAGVGGFLKGVWHSIRRHSPEVAWTEDPGRHTVIILGSPVWAGRLSGPMRSYLRRNRGLKGAVAAFCLSGSGSEASFFREVEQILGRAPVATLSLAQRDVVKGAFDDELQVFVEQVRAALGKTQRRRAKPRA